MGVTLREAINKNGHLVPTLAPPAPVGSICPYVVYELTIWHREALPPKKSHVSKDI